VSGDGDAMKKRKRREPTVVKQKEAADLQPKETAELTPDQVAQLMASYEDSSEEGIKFARAAEQPDEEVVVDDMPLESAINFSEDDMIEIDLEAHRAPPR
jgi:hypothetical protein